MPNRTGAAVALLVTLTACEIPTAAEFPTDQVMPMEAPRQYELWWSVVEQCSGRTGDLGAIHWFVSNTDRPLEIGGELYDGYWWETGNRIAVARTYDGPTVRHEMLHALLNRGDHPLEYFAGRCEGVVKFDAPQAYGLTATELSVAREARADSALRVEIATIPARPAAGGYYERFLFGITATNMLDVPVWVPVRSGVTGWFRFLEQDLWANGGYDDRPRIYFAPGQQRRLMIDAAIDVPGTYHVIGGYAGAESAPTAIAIVP